MGGTSGGVVGGISGVPGRRDDGWRRPTPRFPHIRPALDLDDNANSSPPASSNQESGSGVATSGGVVGGTSGGVVGGISGVPGRRDDGWRRPTPRFPHIRPALDLDDNANSSPPASSNQESGSGVATSGGVVGGTSGGVVGGVVGGTSGGVVGGVTGGVVGIGGVPGGAMTGGGGNSGVPGGVGGYKTGIAGVPGISG